MQPLLTVSETITRLLPRFLFLLHFFPPELTFKMLK
uniref:Uncharacterized protein n=1 Tax=Anguilla anguilla TaxID=7936 RepID=A0A0E9UT09_ANGAN